MYLVTESLTAPTEVVSLIFCTNAGRTQETLKPLQLNTENLACSHALVLKTVLSASVWVSSPS